jgi:hypothetical protein
MPEFVSILHDIGFLTLLPSLFFLFSPIAIVDENGRKGWAITLNKESETYEKDWRQFLASYKDEMGNFTLPRKDAERDDDEELLDHPGIKLLFYQPL